MSDDLSPSVTIWLDDFATRLGVAPPTRDEIVQLLSLAGTAAHGSARQAAPVACWLAARSGRSLDDCAEIADAVAPPPPGRD